MTSLEYANQIVANYAENEADRLLIETAGKKIVNGTEVIVYRPYFVIGLQLWLSTDNNIIKGEGAEFGQNTETSKRYFQMQQLIDLQNNLVIPDQYTCVAMFALIGVETTTKNFGFIVV